MKENKTMDSIHKGILKKYHTLCSVLGLSDDEKHAIVASYGVESSRDMDTHDLIDVCAQLSAQVNRESGAAELDQLRKRTMAAIGQWLRATGQYDGPAVIKGIACRATGHKDFNRIPRERLRNIIATFNNKMADRERIHRELLGMMYHQPATPANEGQLN